MHSNRTRIGRTCSFEFFMAILRLVFSSCKFCSSAQSGMGIQISVLVTARLKPRFYLYRKLTNATSPCWLESVRPPLAGGGSLIRQPRLGRFRTASIGISKTKSKRRQAKQGICGKFRRGLGHSAPDVTGFGPDSSLVASSSRRIKVLLGSFLSQRCQRSNRRASMAFAFAVAPVRR